MGIPYSAEKDDLYYPAKHAVFFPYGRPRSDAALCAEMARLDTANSIPALPLIKTGFAKFWDEFCLPIAGSSRLDCSQRRRLARFTRARWR